MPSYILNPIGEDPHAYDDVAEDQEALIKEVPNKNETAEEAKKQQPVRKAPPVPPPPVQNQEQTVTGNVYFLIITTSPIHAF